MSSGHINVVLDLGRGLVNWNCNVFWSHKCCVGPRTGPSKLELQCLLVT